MRFWGLSLRIQVSMRQINMSKNSLTEQILQEWLSSLNDKKEFPPEVMEKLTELIESYEISDRNKIIEVIKPKP